MHSEDVEYLLSQLHSPAMHCRQCNITRELISKAWLKVPHDYCLQRSGLTCGAKEADHPMWNGPYGPHEFVPGATHFVPATGEEKHDGQERNSWY